MDPKCGFDVKPESSGAGTTSLWTWLRRGGRATPLKQKSSAGKFQQSRKLKVGMGGVKNYLELFLPPLEERALFQRAVCAALILALASALISRRLGWSWLTGASNELASMD